MPKRVLVVERSKPVAAALQKYLEAEDWVVDLHEAPPAASAVIRAGAEVVLLSAEAGGTELCQTLKAAAPQLPVVLTFPPDRDDADRQAAAAGADGVLLGPLKRPVVLSSVRSMARLGGLLRQLAELEQRLESRIPSGGQPGASPAGRPQAGIYDFDFFKKLLLMEIKRSKRYGYPIALGLVAVDGWQALTAPMEPASRTRLASMLLELLTDSVRDIDVPLLYSEERVLVFMPHTPAAGALVVAKRLCSRVRNKFEGSKLTASAGVAGFEGGAGGTVSFATLIKTATEALKRAQTEGGDRAYGPPVDRF